MDGTDLKGLPKLDLVMCIFIGSGLGVAYDRKDFNNEIKNIRHDLMLNEYPHEFVDSIMKPSRSKRPSSDTICQGTEHCKPFQCQDHFQNLTYSPWDIDENWTS
jgi:hypothetical protein